MKMSDVFELPVSRDGFKLKDRCGVSEEIHVAKFADVSACVYAELAINNHDRMADEIAELRAKITKKDEMTSDLTEALCASVDEIAELREALSFLLKSSVYADAEGCWIIEQEESEEVERAKKLLSK
ncbi:coil containing protein [Vibrio phage 1.113.A._10N.286.51.E7]|nr:coil containing protein [Vibrio phage 1.113.A._10N.286.51.E7]